MEPRWTGLEAGTRDVGCSVSASVFVRIKPSASTGRPNALHLFPERPQMLAIQDEQFIFDGVFGPKTNQSSVYATIMCPLIMRLRAGYNCTLVAYGASGTGKTYTMGLSPQKESNEAGIIPRLLNDLLSDNLHCEKNRPEISVSLSQIYGNKVSDLLDNTNLNVKSVYDCSQRPVQTTEEALSLLAQGVAARTVRSTTLNTDSSRSQAVFTVHYKSKDLSGGYSRCSRLRLVDLGGVESVRRTGSTGDAFREGVNINLELLALGQLLRGLRSSVTTPLKYRGKLTLFLKDALDRSSLISLVVCVSNAPGEREATIRSLRVAKSACAIKLQPEHVRAFKEYIASECSVDASPMPSSKSKPSQIPEPPTPTAQETTAPHEAPVSFNQISENSLEDLQPHNTRALRSLRTSPVTALNYEHFSHHSTPKNNMKASEGELPWSKLRDEIRSAVREEVFSAMRPRARLGSDSVPPSPIPQADARCRLNFNFSPNGPERDELMFKMPQLPVSKKVTKKNTRNTTVLKKTEQTKDIKESYKESDKENVHNGLNTRRRPGEPNDSNLDVSDSDSLSIKTPRRSIRIINILASRENTMEISQNDVPTPRRITRLSVANNTRNMDSSYDDFKHNRSAQNSRAFENKTQKKITNLRRKHDQDLQGMTPRSKKVANDRIEKSLLQLHRESVMEILNNGSEKHLMSLATVGPKTASLIYTHRMLHGKFKSEEDLKMASFWRGAKAFDRFMMANNVIVDTD